MTTEPHAKKQKVGSKYKDSPYLTPRLPHPQDTNGDREKYTVDDKFIVDQVSTAGGILQMPVVSNSNEYLLKDLLEVQKDTYVKKMTLFFTGSDFEFASKLFILACLMSILVEIEDNKIGGGKNVQHPLYCFSRFRSDVSTGGRCQFWIEIKPPQDKTHFLDETYTELLEDLKKKDVRPGLLEYSSAMARVNWLRKILVLYIAWNINGNNDSKRFQVTCNKKDVVTRVAYSIIDENATTSTSDDTDRSTPYFTNLEFKEWCRKAFLWIHKLLVNVPENQFRYCELQKLIQRTPKTPPTAAQGNNMDSHLKSLLKPKVKAKVHKNQRITKKLKREISAIFTEKKQTDEKHIADIVRICNERKAGFELEVQKNVKEKGEDDEQMSNNIMEILGMDDEIGNDE